MASIALLGSGEFLPWATAVDRWCIESSPVGSDRVLVAPTASAPEGEASFRRWARMGLEHYRAIGMKPEVLDVRTREHAEDPARAAAVAGARLVFFSGGNPGYLAETLRDTVLWRAILDAVAAGTALGGCSAGSVAFGVEAPDVNGAALRQWVPGLALLESAYVIAHFDALDGYVPGLQRMLVEHTPESATMVGLDEDTALYGDGSAWTVAGAGAAWLKDGGELRPVRAGGEVSLRLTARFP
ncbi:MAG TPA: Type 1 glutamine amidotransferase-like domain-containing protein [Actinomycetota bacterium]